MTQIFKKQIPIKILFNLLEDICMKNDKCYILTPESYKKAVFNNLIEKFIESCKPYYHKSKILYIERKIDYNSFITIIRQICKYNRIMYTSEIKYNKSKYDIIYFIYFSDIF